MADLVDSKGVFERAVVRARDQYGEIDVPPDLFIERLRAIASRHLPCGATECEMMDFCGTLHAADLYLAIGCALHDATAWKRFTADYMDYIQSLASTLVETTDEAMEFADALIVDLFLPDRTGESRIASYSGRSSLATWLRVLICHRAINGRKKTRPLQPIESLPEQHDHAAAERLDATMRSHRYGKAVEGSLREACGRLTERERLVLLLRYERSLKIAEIAELLHVHPSNVTRHIERACERLRRRVLSILDCKYRLPRAAIDECVRELFENPAYSILSMLRESAAVKHTLQQNAE